MLSGKWRYLSLLAFAELLAMTLWFSATAVVPQLTSEWHLTDSQASWLTMSVQLGFVVGALLSALGNLPDRISLPLLIGVRFLTDWISGDRYFATRYPEHNLDRARNQLALYRDLDARRGELRPLIVT